MVRVRAAMSLVLLALFPVVVLAVLTAVVAVAVWVGSASGVAGVKVAWWFALPLVAAVWVAVRDAARARPQPSRAPELRRGEHPRLWGEVDELAAGLRTAPPARIVVTPEVNASVTEAGGHREMTIGLPLLLAMTHTQLRAVLAHELGHYGAGHTRLLALSYRARDAVFGTMSNLSGGPARWLLVGYAKLYLIVAAWANRSQEREADDYAGRVAGPEAAASAFRRLLIIDAAWDILVEDYLPLADAAHRRPALGDGLVNLLGARHGELEQAVDAYVSLGGRQSLYDSHPPISERIARLMADGPRAAAEPLAEPAWTLLGEGERSLAALEDAVLHDGVSADWDELVALAGARIAVDAAGDLARSAQQAGLQPPVTLHMLLNAVERGEGARIVASLVNPGVHPQQRAEAERIVLTHVLTATVTHALLEVGRAVHRVNWSGPWTLRDVATDELLELEPLVAEAVAEPSAVGRLRERLVELGAASAAHVEAVAESEPQMLAVATQVQTGQRKKRFDLIACTTGVLLVPSQPPSRWTGGMQTLIGQQRRSEEDRLEFQADQGVAVLRQLPDAVWTDTDDIAAGKLAPRPYGWLLQLRLLNGEEMRIKSTTDTSDHGEPLDAVIELLGARAGKEAWAAAPA